MYLVYILRVKDQRRTKDKPRNDLRTPNHQKVLFLKIAVSFPSLILCLSSPTDDRENSDSTPRLQKVTFVKIGFPRRLPPFLKKLSSFPKNVDSFPKNVSLLCLLANGAPITLACGVMGYLTNHIRILQAFKV